MIRCINIYCCTTENITRHHLIPKPFRCGEKVEKVFLCEDCHKRVHELKSITELFLKYTTKQSIVELLANDIQFRVTRLLTVIDMNMNYPAVA